MNADEPWTHHEAVVNGVRLHYVEAGEGPLVVLLHGFPEFWYSWREQIPALTDAGFRVVAPDMRGYNTSERPRALAAYDLDALVADVVALIRHAGEERAVVVGHDWGGVVAWELAARHPDVVEKLVVMNAPHPDALRRELRSLSQLRRSWYALAFQVPWLPELLIRANLAELLDALFRDGTVRPDAFTDEDVRRYEEALSRPGALTAAIDYYRALGRRVVRELRSGGLDERTVPVPTLLVWGERDPALGVELTEGLERWVPDARVERLPDAGHWVQNDAPERVNELLVDFLSSRC